MFPRLPIFTSFLTLTNERIALNNGLNESSGFMSDAVPENEQLNEKAWNNSVQHC